MKIALLGYGKMGKEIEKIALSRNHEIILKKNNDTSFDGLEHADVAIDFSTPSSAVENIKTSINRGIPVVCGTTGWLDNYDEIVAYTQEKKGSFLYGSNFSVGVNIFFKLNEYLAKLMAKYPEYQLKIEEIHHTQKIDAPSGTAISLANQIIKNSDYSDWKLLENQEIESKSIPVKAIREEGVPGTHTVDYQSSIDTIQIKHIAHNRKGFALGAVLAAEWILGKKGIFSMQDVLSL